MKSANRRRSGVACATLSRPHRALAAGILYGLLGCLADALACAADRPTATDTPSGGSPAAEAHAAAPSVEAARTSRLNGSAQRRVVGGNSVESSARVLTRTLDLDARQQARLRELLESERQQLRQLWGDARVSGTDRVRPTLAIFDRTRDQIRAMLTDEQKKRYPAPIARELTAPAQADPEHWLQLMHPATGSDVASVK